MNKKVLNKIDGRKYNYIITLFLLMTLFFTANAAPFHSLTEQLAWDKNITINLKNETLKKILYEIQKQSGISFIIKDEKIVEGVKLSLQVKNVKVREALDKLLTNTKLTYKVAGNLVTILKEKEQQTALKADNIKQLTVSGKVIDEKGVPIVGATILVKGTNKGCITTERGLFTLIADSDNILEVSFMGMSPTFHDNPLEEGKEIVIIMKSTAIKMDDVVVTGIFTRKKDSFTGSSVTFGEKELKAIGNQNVLQSLRTLDPSFAIIENNEFGSDPNRLPDIEIRGKTSIVGLRQEYTTDPNQPLFILDGFESSLSVINDMSMDRIESITLLKDAAATAIYGSKAANGVVVVYTKTPVSGKLRFSYNGNLTLSFADLSDYNLMNSSEKIVFERLAGFYGPLDGNGTIINEDHAIVYNNRMAEVARGVNSYWLNEPLRFATTHKHDVYVDGGDAKMRYGIGINYGSTTGVMKNSSKDILNGNIRLMYNVGNFTFSNQFNVDYSLSNRESVPFSAFSNTNPFYRKRDENGDIKRVLSPSFRSMMSSGNINYDAVYSPLYDMNLGNVNKYQQVSFRDNFEATYNLKNTFSVRARFSFTYFEDKSDVFTSPKHSKYVDKDVLKQGEYNKGNADGTNYNGDVTLNYAKTFKDKHILNAALGMVVSHSSNLTSSYNVEGFVDDNFSSPAFSNGFSSTDTKPKYVETSYRSVSYFLNAGYSFNNKYLIDMSYRSDGSSVFGVDNKFKNTWSVGLGWNIHNEKFMKDSKIINYLKLRSSIGNPGNQNFDAYMSMKTFMYNTWNRNPFGLSVIINSFGNENLKWQKTTDFNIGLDGEILNRKVRMTIDAFRKYTDPLLIFLDLPSSSGTDNQPRNLGAQETIGLTASINYTPINKDKFHWIINGNIRTSKAEYKNIGKTLENYNVDNAGSEQINRKLSRYYDGGSPTSMWAVRSLGIDPTTGREMFARKDGSQTFAHNYSDEVIVGNSTPKIEGVLGTTIYYNNFSLSINFRYRVGGQIAMSSLYEKVENISEGEVRYNQDKRALQDRWQKEGDNARYKSISLTEITPMSSRFVVDENTISCESISLGYEITGDALKNIGISALTVRGYMNEIFRLSNVKNERGIQYPFARSVSFSFGFKF